jgi:cytochrome c
MRKLIVFLIMLLAITLVACGGSEATPGTGGDVQAGQQVFDEIASPPCSSCHSIEAGVTLVGPSLAHIATEAATQVPGESAEEYLRQSIEDPNAYIVPGFSGIMPTTYGSQLSSKQINDLVAYMMTLK